MTMVNFVLNQNFYKKILNDLLRDDFEKVRINKNYLKRLAYNSLIKTKYKGLFLTNGLFHGALNEFFPIENIGTQYKVKDFNQLITLGKSLVKRSHKIKQMISKKRGNKYNLVSSYGLADSIEQIYKKYNFLKNAKEDFFIIVNPIFKAQEHENGFRFHKWGDYIGKKKIDAEYIKDSKNFESILIYNVYKVEKIKPQ